MDEAETESKMQLFFDRDGKPISHETWAKHFEDDDYRFFRRTELGEQTCEQTVLTHWNGVRVMNQYRIFEVSVCTNGEWEDVAYYETEAEALKAHEQVVEELKQSQ